MSASGPLSKALTTALRDTPTLPRDAAAIALAKRYAAALDALPDDVEELDSLGPKYLKVLESLGMTPAGRNARGGAANGPAVPAARPIDELRARRAQRARVD